MNGSKFTAVLISCLLIGTQLNAQESFFEHYQEKLDSYHFEKIFLHTDRNIYSVKEDIWFKLYLLDGKIHIPLAGRNIGYVDLLNPQGRIILHKPFFIENGTGQGSFSLGDTLETGVYTIYAYTNYMRNFGNESFFKKKITISQILPGTVNQLETDSLAAPDYIHSSGQQEVSKPRINLQFMPEGGYLANNISNRLAFKITTLTGEEINLKGAIKNNEGKLIDSIYCTHLGMGKTYIMPNPGMKYHAVLDEFPSDTFQLPPSYDKPLLRYIGIKDSIVQFSLYDLSIRDQEKTYYIAVKAKGELTFYIEKVLRSEMTNMRIPVQNFQRGLNQVILLDSRYVPLSERLIYIPGTSRAELDIQLARENFKTREKAEVTLVLKNPDDIIAGGSFSMAVINLDQLAASDIFEEDIVSYLDLTSEIRGPVKNPNHYFSHPYDSVWEDLDLLLLTQGWTKYIWDHQYISSLPSFKYQKETGFSVSGHAKRMVLNSELIEGRIILFIPSEYLIIETSTDSTGYYHFDNLVLFDSTSIMVQSKNKGNRGNARLMDVEYLITPPPLFPDLGSPTPIFTELDAYNRFAYPRYVSNSYFDYDKSTILIDEVSIVEKRKPEDDGHFRIYSRANNVVNMDDYPYAGSQNILTFLQGLVPGLYIEGNHISIRGAQHPPLILLDGIEKQMDEVNLIPLVEIDKIEVLKDASNTAIFGMKGGNGVIAIYTRRGENVYYDTPTFHIISKSIEGFAKSKAFYMPDYENEVPNPALIDHRATVFWAPNLIPDSTGSCSVSYFNSDDTGNIVIFVQGILNNGKPGLDRAFYQVARK